MSQHADERASRRDSQDLDETEASHCTGDVSSVLAERDRRTRKQRCRGADTARRSDENNEKSNHWGKEHSQLQARITLVGRSMSLLRVQKTAQVPQVHFTEKLVGEYNSEQ